MLRTPRHAAFAALATFLAGVAICALALLPSFGRWLDAAALEGFLAVQRRPELHPTLDGIGHLADALPFALAGAALIAIALARGQRRVALAIPVILIGSAVSAQVLKIVLAEPRHWSFLGESQIAAESFPSGHATAAMALALCAVIAVGPRARPYVAALGAAFAIAVGYAILSLGWHFPSDVLGGFLTAATWTLAGVAVLRLGEGRSAPRPAVALAPSALLGVGMAGLALIALVARPSLIVDHTAGTALAVAIGALGVVLAAGLAAGLSGPRRAPTAARRRGSPPGRG
jgi:membrane-associated phospholipid phosphatase